MIFGFGCLGGGVVFGFWFWEIVFFNISFELRDLDLVVKGIYLDVVFYVLFCV